MPSVYHDSLYLLTPFVLHPFMRKLLVFLQPVPGLPTTADGYRRAIADLMFFAVALTPRLPTLWQARGPRPTAMQRAWAAHLRTAATMGKSPRNLRSVNRLSGVSESRALLAGSWHIHHRSNAERGAKSGHRRTIGTSTIRSTHDGFGRPPRSRV